MSNDNDEVGTYRYCPGCGTQATDRAKFCGECGRSLIKQVVPASNKVPQPPVTPEVAAVEVPSQATAASIPLVAPPPPPAHSTTTRAGARRPTSVFQCAPATAAVALAPTSVLQSVGGGRPKC